MQPSNSSLHAGRWLKVTAVALAAICLLVDFLPRHAAPEFRYTGSDPAIPVWNLGWPGALFIYDPKHGFQVGPFAYVMLPLQFFVLAVGLIIFRRRATAPVQSTETDSTAAHLGLAARLKRGAIGGRPVGGCMATPSGRSRRRDAFGVAMSSLHPPKDMATRQAGRGGSRAVCGVAMAPGTVPSATARDPRTRKPRPIGSVKLVGDPPRRRNPLRLHGKFQHRWLQCRHANVTSS
jgi:hypothetical protein